MDLLFALWPFSGGRRTDYVLETESERTGRLARERASFDDMARFPGSKGVRAFFGILMLVITWNFASFVARSSGECDANPATTTQTVFQALDFP